MKRRYQFFIIAALALLILLIYFTCQEKKELSRPEETIEVPAPKPSETRQPEKEAPPAQEKAVIPQEERVASIPERQPENLEVAIAKTVEKPLAALVDKPEEKVAPEEKELIAAIPVPDKVLEKPSAIIMDSAEDHITKQQEPAPVIQIEPAADPSKRIAILPFDNLTDNAGAVSGILPWIQGGLEKRGFQVVDEDITGEVLCREHIRLANYLPREDSRKVGTALKAGALLAGTIFAYDTDKNPGLGISARLIDTATGYIIWADYASDTGEDFTGLLGLGTITSIHTLIPKVVDQLLVSFHNEPLQAEPESMYKVAVLPFQNLSTDRHAGMAVTHLFLVQLFKNKLFNPVEFGDVRKMIVDLRVRHKGELGFKNLNDISNSLGAGILLTGTVEDFSRGVSGVYPPKVAISARLLDSSQNKIVWFNALTMDGEDKVTAFEWGKMRSPDKVAYAVVTDLVKNMEKAPWH